MTYGRATKFPDLVRIRFEPTAPALGLAGLRGQVYGLTAQSTGAAGVQGVSAPGGA